MVHSNQLRLAVLTNTPTPYRIAFFNALQQEALKSGATLQVLFCAEREPFRYWKIDLSQQTYSWRILPGINPHLGYWYPHVNLAVVKALRDFAPTHLLSAGAWNTPTMLLAAQHWAVRIPIRIFWNEGHADAVLHPTGLIAWLRRCALRAYDAFAVPNSRSGDFVRTEVGKPKPVLLLPNTVDEEFFNAALELRSSAKAAIRQDYDLPQNGLVVTTVAQLVERKGVLELVEGYKRASADVKRRVTIVLLGDGPLNQTLKDQVQALGGGDVRLLGHLDQAAVRNVLAASDAFILPTKRDPNPISVIEAAFAGLPLLVTDQAGNARDLVSDRANGYILPECTPDHIAAALNWFATLSDSERATMGQTSVDIAQRGFRRDKIARRFLEEAGNLLHQPNR